MATTTTTPVANTSHTGSQLGFSQFNQIEIKSIKLYREDWPTEKQIDIAPGIEELNIYEDVLDGATITATILMSDPANIPDALPIVGGERINLEFKTPTYNEETQIEFVIYKIGERVFDKANTRHQGYLIYLCTVDRYVDSYTDVSMSFKGTYSDIVNNTLNILKSTRNIDVEPTIGLQKFIAPFWSPLKICQWCAKRSYGKDFDPYVFYETLDGYNFKSLKTLYSQPSYTRFFIEPKKTEGMAKDINKLFRSVIDYEYLESNDKLVQNAEGIMGSKVYELNVVDKIITKSEYDYTSMFTQSESVTLENYTLYDDVGPDKRNKAHFILSRQDGSNQGLYYRKMIFGLMGTYRMRIMIQGDSSIRAGMVVDMDVPARKTTKDMNEQLTSGKWFVCSLRHILKRDAYYTVLELCKDSYPIDVEPQLNG